MSEVSAQAVSVVDLLGVEVDDVVQPRPDLWGFGGMHGGLVLALLAQQMQHDVPAGHLRSVSAQYHRPVRKPFGVGSTVVRAGRTVAALSAQASAEGRAAVTAAAIFALDGDSGVAVGTAAPEAPPPLECPVFTIPPEFVPFARHTEIRPVGPNRPFAGCEAPELTAWIRLVGDEHPPDALRLLVLMDSLAPSYAAVLRAPVPIPTIEFSVRPTGAAGEPSPWILLHARTRNVSGGWVDELIDAWSPEGVHLAAASQLRRVVA